MADYTFKKIRGADVRVVLKDGKQSNLFVHVDNEVPGFRFVIWQEGRKMGRFTSLANVKKALILRNL